MITNPSVVDRLLVPDFHLIASVADTGNDLVDLWEASPVHLDSNEPKTDEIIDILFPGNPFLCCGWTRSYFDTRPRNHWYKLDELQLIVPNPMTAKQGLTRTGKLSPHTLSNTGPRRFLVIEFDFDPSRSREEALLLARLNADGRDESDLCASLLSYLAERAPLALVVHSGGKSLHGWFYCEGQDEEFLLPFIEAAVSLGADRATGCRSQFVRMPDGTRDNGKRQTIYFFNPEVVQ